MRETETEREMRTIILLSCGAIGSIFFVIVFLIQDTTHEGYLPLQFAVSSLSIGKAGWIQICNFIITGLLILAFSFGLRLKLSSNFGSFWIPFLIGMAGIGLIGAGIFTSDPIFGYPTDMPLKLNQYTTQGHMHDLFSVLAFFGIIRACFLMKKRFRIMHEKGWANYSMFTGVFMLATFILAGLCFKRIIDFYEFAGLIQRICIILGWTWMTLLSVYLLRK